MTRGTLLVAATRWLSPLAPAALVPLAFVLAGCGHKIGDSCSQSTDCSVTGTLVCDTSQPGGYCTELNCTENSCQNSAVCVLFQASVPGCAYNDYHAPARTGRSFCMAYCTKDSDCRHNEGYVCRDPTKAPWSAAVLDDSQGRFVCIQNAGPLADAAAKPDAQVCSYTPEEAGMSEEGDSGEDAAIDASSDGGVEAGPEGGSDAGNDGAPVAADAGGDGATDAGSDATLEAGSDASVDAGSADALGGD